MRQLRSNLVRELCPPYALSTLSHTGRITALQHESLHIAMEDGSIVVSRCRERQEVEGSARHEIAEDLQLNVAMVGVQRHRHEARDTRRARAAASPAHTREELEKGV